MKIRREVIIGDLKVGDGYPVCVVAELGVNHLGDFNRAKEMIHAAHEAGADLLKFQTYISEKRYDKGGNPRGQEFIKLLKEWEFPRDKDAQLWDYAKSLGATVFTSPFDDESVNFAEEMGTVAYKLAAFEIVNHKLIRSIAEKGKPVILSRGMASEDEIKTAIDILEQFNVSYIILHCISSYPLEKKDSNLRMIHSLRRKYNCPIGHSDHTLGTDIPPLAVAAGANMIEKHFTITPKRRESDNFFSITPEDLKDLIWKVRQVEQYMGRDDVVKIDTEEYMWSFRRDTK
jgi:sialic acid synthase SpsE